MKNQISIIGLGQIGASIGLALAEYDDQIHRVGHDRSRTVAKEAINLGAVDAIPARLAKSVRDADLVILAIPLHEIRQTLEVIAEILQPGTLVMDTAPIKKPVIRWVKKFLPESIGYAGLTPSLQAAYMEDTEYGIAAARRDLFEGCQIAVISGDPSTSEAIESATSLVGLIGAQPFFADAVEIDGLMSMTYLLPQIIAASLLSISQDAPGWRDARKVSGKGYAHVTAPILPDELPAALASSLVRDKENSSRLINDLIRELVAIRDQADREFEEELLEKFTHLQESREGWWRAREQNQWTDHPAPTLPKRSLLTELFGFQTRPSQKKDDTPYG